MCCIEREISMFWEPFCSEAKFKPHLHCRKKRLGKDKKWQRWFSFSARQGWIVSCEQFKPALPRRWIFRFWDHIRTLSFFLKNRRGKGEKRHLPVFGRGVNAHTCSPHFSRWLCACLRDTAHAWNQFQDGDRGKREDKLENRRSGKINRFMGRRNSTIQYRQCKNTEGENGRIPHITSPTRTTRWSINI